MIEMIPDMRKNVGRDDIVDISPGIELKVNYRANTMVPWKNSVRLEQNRKRFLVGLLFAGRIS